MDHRSLNIQATRNNKIVLKVIQGHFATSHTHVNLYLDMTSMKTRQSEAEEVGRELAHQYVNHVSIDTIVCMDGCEVIGAFLAQELAKSSMLSVNAHKSINIITPEINTDGKMMIRDNNLSAVNGANILLLVASVTTGNTIRKTLECIDYYGGKIQGVGAIFSAVDSIDNIQVYSVFHKTDIPEYQTYMINECPFCKAQHKLEAIINGYGYIQI